MVFDVFCSINKSVLQFVFQVFQSRSSLPAFSIIETLLCKDKKQLVEYILPFSSSILLPIFFLSSLLAETLEIHDMKTLQRPSGIDRRTWRTARHKLSQLLNLTPPIHQALLLLRTSHQSTGTTWRYWLFESHKLMQYLSWSRWGSNKPTSTIGRRHDQAVRYTEALPESWAEALPGTSMPVVLGSQQVT